MSFGLKWESDGVVKKFTAVVNDEDFIAATTEVQNHPDFSRIWFVINDLSDVNSFEVSPQTIETYFSSVANAYRANDKIKITFVSQDSLIEELINSFILANPLPYRLRVFKSVNEARNWCKGLKSKNL